MKHQLVHIDDLRVGDTVLHDGGLLTVSRSNLRHDRFMGRTLQGDSYRLGAIPVVRVSLAAPLTTSGKEPT